MADAYDDDNPIGSWCKTALRGGQMMMTLMMIVMMMVMMMMMMTGMMMITTQLAVGVKQH